MTIILSFCGIIHSMNFMLIDYTDPLFSIVIFLLVILTVFFANRFLEKFKIKAQKRHIVSFAKSFAFSKRSKDYKGIINAKHSMEESLLLQATLCQKRGQYEEAIKIYLPLLESVKAKKTKIDIMVKLGKTYLKAGFMQRSKDILIEALSIVARNKEALSLLLIIYEGLKEYNSCKDVLISLNEIGENTSKEEVIIDVLSTINNAKLTNDKKASSLVQIYKKNPFVYTIVYDFLSSFASDVFWEILNDEQIPSCIDILWNIPKDDLSQERIEKSQTLKEIYTAKNYYNFATKSDIFELDVLIALEDKNKADLNFEYVCDECANGFPTRFYRCPICHKVLTQTLSFSLVAKNTPYNDASAGFY